MTTFNNDLIKRIRMDGDEIRQVTVDGDIVFNLDADLVLDLFNTGTISADTLGLYQNSIFDSLDVTVGGNTDFTAQSVSQTTSGSNFDITINGNYQPTSESVTIEGSGAYDSVYKNYNDVYSTSDIISVGDTAPPENETVFISETTYELNELWEATNTNELDGTSVYEVEIGGGSIFIGNQEKNINVYNATTGTQTTSFELGGANVGDYYTPLAADANSLYVGSEDNTFFASYDSSTGAEEWRYNDNYDNGYLASVSQNYVLFATRSDLILFDKNTGTKQFEIAKGAESIDINENANAIAIGKNRTIEVYNLNGNQQFSKTLTDDHYEVHVAIDPTLQDRVHVGIGTAEDTGDYYRLYDFNGNLLNSDAADSYYYTGGGSREESVDDIISHGNGCYAIVYDQYGSAELHEWDGDGHYSGQDNITGTREQVLVYGSGIMGVANNDSSEMKFYYVGGGETTVTVGSNTVTTSDRPTTESINLSSGSTSVSIDSEPQVDVDIDWNEDNRTTDPSVTIDGSTVSHNGPLANGQTETGSIDITGTGTYTASVTTNGEVTVDVDWTERNIVKDVDFTFNGITESVTGPILNDEQNTLSFGVSDIIDGDNSVDVTAGGNSNPDLQITFLLNTEDAMALTDFEPNWDYDEKGDSVLLEYWFDVSSVDAPAEAVEGDPFSVDATIENIGITPVEQDVVMTHTGKTLTKTTNLNDKESINVTFDTVINEVGEQTVVVESPQESASDLIQILSKYQLDISIDGASDINTEINADYSTSVYPSFDPSVYFDGSLAGTATNNSGENINLTKTYSEQLVEKHPLRFYVNDYGDSNVKIGTQLPYDITKIEMSVGYSTYDGYCENTTVELQSDDSDFFVSYNGGGSSATKTWERGVDLTQAELDDVDTVSTQSDAGTGGSDPFVSGGYVKVYAEVPDGADLV